MVWRDIKVRYKQTILGILWIVIQPFITIVVFSATLGGFSMCLLKAFPTRFSFTLLFSLAVFCRRFNPFLNQSGRQRPFDH